MKKIYIQLFIVTIGILLCIISHNSIKKYFYKNHFTKEKHIILVYNKNINNDYKPNIIETTKKQETSTTKTTTTVITTTKSIITTSTKTTKKIEEVTKPQTIKKITTTINTENNETIKEESVVKDNKEIIYDGLTLLELTEKLNKNLTSTLTNTGHYFANYYMETGLDPYLAVAIVLQETGCKWTCSKLVRNCNNIGGIKGEPKCNGGSYKRYDTLEDGIRGYLNMLYNNYYAKGLTTPELINPKYATSTSWSVNVNKYIDTIKES